MTKTWPRLLLLPAALALLSGGIMHGRAFNKAVATLGAVDLPPFYANSFKALWLIDSATLISLAIVFTLIAARPATVTRWIVILLAFIPGATAALIYIFVGSFFPAHLLAAASIATIAAGSRFSPAPPQ